MMSRHSWVQVEHTIECAPLCKVVSRVAEAMLADLNPCCYKRRRIISSDTCLANDSISPLRDRDVALRSIKLMWVRCMLSRLLVIVVS